MDSSKRPAYDHLPMWLKYQSVDSIQQESYVETKEELQIILRKQGFLKGAELRTQVSQPFPMVRISGQNVEGKVMYAGRAWHIHKEMRK